MTLRLLPSLWDWFSSLTQASLLLLRRPGSCCSSPGLQGILGGPFYLCFPSVTSSRCVTPTPPRGFPSLLSRLQVCLPSAVGPTGNTTATCCALVLLSVPTPSDRIRPITPLFLNFYLLLPLSVWSPCHCQLTCSGCCHLCCLSCWL